MRRRDTGYSGRVVRFWLAMGLGVSFAWSAQAGRRWRTYDNCHMVPSDANDGDSFHMKYTRPGYGRRYFIRLYWVDTPESDRSIPDRVKEQAEYWGITEDQVIKLGKEATRFTRRFLKDGFVVYSKLQDARGRSTRKRNYANVKVGDQYLSEALVEAGLARIHGFQEVHPDGPKASTFRQRLKAAEARAKKNRRGVWALVSPGDQVFEHAAPWKKTEWPERGKGAAPGATNAASSVVISRPAVPTAPSPESSGSAWEPRTVTTPQRVAVYSLKDKRYVGSLPPGREVTVLGPVAAGMMRVRFKAGEKRMIEAQCSRFDLGL